MAKGRPSKKTPELMNAICERIANGESLHKMCPGIGVTRETVRAWLVEDSAFSVQYARAREEQADRLADECIEIADDKSMDIIEVGEGGDIRSITNSAAVQRAKIQIEARKWKAGQLAPKRWGQQSTRTEITGANGEPIKFVVEVVKGKE